MGEKQESKHSKTFWWKQEKKTSLQHGEWHNGLTHCDTIRRITVQISQGARPGLG